MTAATAAADRERDPVGPHVRADVARRARDPSPVGIADDDLAERVAGLVVAGRVGRLAEAEHAVDDDPFSDFAVHDRQRHPVRSLAMKRVNVTTIAPEYV
jgi:hypothetical protein